MAQPLTNAQYLDVYRNNKERIGLITYPNSQDSTFMLEVKLPNGISRKVRIHKDLDSNNFQTFGYDMYEDPNFGVLNTLTLPSRSNVAEKDLDYSAKRILDIVRNGNNSKYIISPKRRFHK